MNLMLMSVYSEPSTQLKTLSCFGFDKQKIRKIFKVELVVLFYRSNNSISLVKMSDIYINGLSKQVLLRSTQEIPITSPVLQIEDKEDPMQLAIFGSGMYRKRPSVEFVR